MHLRTVRVATVGFIGTGIYGGLGAVRNLVWVCCHLYRFSLPCGAAIAICAFRRAGVWGWNALCTGSLSLCEAVVFFRVLVLVRRALFVWLGVSRLLLLNLFGVYCHCLTHCFFSLVCCYSRLGLVALVFHCTGIDR